MPVSKTRTCYRSFNTAGIDVLADVHGDAALGVEHDVVPLDLDGDIAMIRFAP